MFAPAPPRRAPGRTGSGASGPVRARRPVAGSLFSEDDHHVPQRTVVVDLRRRRRGDVERILSAETRGDTHHIRYLTKDGKVKTQKFRSC